jgi:hypothetical protein
MENKHEDKMKKESMPKLRSMRIEFHHDTKGNSTGHTIHHEHMASPSKSGAFAMGEKPASFPFGANAENEVMAHVKKHLGAGRLSDSVEAPRPEGSEQEEEEEQDPT